ncbi:PREDICTED: E3 ubiquitin-protein ligase DTX3L [Calidris pugnax]|uniref:E3 ubiquitin-protein ligase DTX3L n=1 Tax=Calidris pugnax TaxID=198806 RepID=UPI00071E1182|nr:PREDICTED: E3 ubiquitin-protein ligase DTX3L [Calidris pugnax]
MAAPATLLVRLCPAPSAAEKALLKLQSYFQSAKRSGGGECEVRPGPELGTYWVHFQQERDKRSVESRRDHMLEMGGQRLSVIIQGGEGEPGRSPVPAQASASSPPPQRAAGGHGDEAAGEVITKKIFLTVSATLNTSMFTEEQRDKIAIICPNLKREGNPNIDGCEKLTGDFTDIEKAYHYFKDILAGSDRNGNFSHSGSKKHLEDENGLNSEETNELTVPSAHYEYFNHTCKEQIKAVQEDLGVRIRSKDLYNGHTSVCFTSDESPASIQEAEDFFIRTFQRSVEHLTQEKIPVRNSSTLKETIMQLNARFSGLLAKEEGNQLLLRGPASEISAAKEFLAEGENSRTEKNMKISSELYRYRNGVEVAASMFKLLETTLNKEIEDIKDKFDTVIEKKDSSCGQKVFIIFRPGIKTSDMSSHATESFINALQNAFAMLREKVISWKLSEDQKKILNLLLNGKQWEGLRVKLKKEEDKLILSGLPKHLSAAEKHIIKLLNIEDSIQTKSRTPLFSDLSYQEATGASEKKYNSRENNSLSSEGHSKAKAEDNKDVCPICMETIENKEILRKCKHAFCRSCIKQAMTYKQVCPVCNTVYGVVEGDQPEGTMSHVKLASPLPGYPGCGTIEIRYSMQGGIQTSNHPNPGKPYGSIRRTAYLPDNKEGQEILQLLKRAFKQKLIFTVGHSRTTGAGDVITWNDIHHKTSIDGGPTNFGYPDPDYLQRVRSELKARGIE